MNLIMQLLKTFLRSAVSQVGRDGGRIVSNKVYNGGEKRTEVQAETINIKIERKDE
jgi:hypothetical protein